MPEHRTHLIERPVASLKPYPGNARTHSKKQVRQIADSIKRFGFTNPVLVSDEGEIIAGHGRVEAARLLGITHVPTLALSHLSAAERRAYVLADNKLALNAGWDRDILAIELQALTDMAFDIEVTGFSLAEVDLLLDGASDARTEDGDTAEDALPILRSDSGAVTRMVDVWDYPLHSGCLERAGQILPRALHCRAVISAELPISVSVMICGQGSGDRLVHPASIKSDTIANVFCVTRKMSNTRTS
jgi:ParB-like nuclease domain